MNLTHLDDETLLRDTKNLVKSEKEILTALLHHLKENERRRLFAAQKYESIYDYLIRGLGYTENEAYPRIQAMRLLRDVPEIEEKINSGELSLTNLDKIREVSEEKIEIKFTAKKALGDKIQKLKGLMAHTQTSRDQILRFEAERR